MRALVELTAHFGNSLESDVLPIPAQSSTSCCPGMSGDDAIFQKAPIGMATTDEERLIERANLEFCRITGYPENELLGRALNAIILSPQQDGSESSEKRCVRRSGE